jgi:HSP20 family molecular chaperone IbpA
MSSDVQTTPRAEVPAATKTTPKYRVTPRYGMHFADGKYILQIALPGVSKSDIHMKTLTDYFQLQATRGDVEYVLNLEFAFDVEQEKTKATYNEGLLRVEFVRMNPMDHAHEIKLE